MWETLQAAFHRPKTRVYRVVEGVVYFLVLLSLALLGLEAIPQSHDWPGLHSVARRIDLVVLGLFAIELTLRVLTYHPPQLDVFEMTFPQRVKTHLKGRLRFLLRPMQLVDLAAVIAVVPGLRGLRMLRLLRLVRTSRFFRYSNPFRGLMHAFESNRLLFTFAYSVLAVETILGGLTIYLVERGVPGAQIASPADGLWWALVTLTTVGYGDFSPVSGLGKIIGGFLMVGGMLTLSLFAGVVGHTLLSAVLSLREEQFRMTGYVNHIIVMGYERGSALLLDALREEIDIEETRVVLFGDRERPTDVPTDFLWVQGDPTKESELEKVRVSHASNIIVVGARAITPQLADAATILTIFTVRSYMRKEQRDAKRKKPLHIVAEILDPENVEHATSAGADEIIETLRLGFSMLSHTVRFQGVGKMTSSMIGAGENNLYTGLLPQDIAMPLPFAEMAAQIHAATGALVIGWRDLGTGQHHVNPPDEEQVPEGAQVLYLAEKPVLEIG